MWSQIPICNLRSLLDLKSPIVTCRISNKIDYHFHTRSGFRAFSSRLTWENHSNWSIHKYLVSKENEETICKAFTKYRWCHFDEGILLSLCVRYATETQLPRKVIKVDFRNMQNTDYTPDIIMFTIWREVRSFFLWCNDGVQKAYCRTKFWRTYFFYARYFSKIWPCFIQWILYSQEDNSSYLSQTMTKQ